MPGAVDRRGIEVNPGDFLLDDRGKVFEVEPTDESITKEGIVSAHEVRARKVGPSVYVRAYHAFVTALDDLPPAPNRRDYYRALYQRHVASEGRERMKARHRIARKAVERR